MTGSDKAIITVNVAASDRPIWSGKASYVVVPSTNGAMGILPNHEPILSLLEDGPLTVTDLEGVKHTFQVSDGFVSFDDNRLTVAIERCSVEQKRNSVPAQQ